MREPEGRRSAAPNKRERAKARVSADRTGCSTGTVRRPELPAFLSPADGRTRSGAEYSACSRLLSRSSAVAAQLTNAQADRHSMTTVLAPLPDVQSRGDDRGVALDDVGVRDIRYPIAVLERGGGVQK